MNNPRISVRAAGFALTDLAVHTASRCCGSPRRTNRIAIDFTSSSKRQNVLSVPFRVFSSGSCFPARLSPNLQYTQARWHSAVSTRTQRSLSTDAKDIKDLILDTWVKEIPHPDKKDKGGEDAHFVLTRSPADGSSSIGVADGVGGWSEVGVDAGVYSRALMAHCKMRLESDISPPCPMDALSVAYRMVRVQGSSTACVAVLHRRKLETLNLGDSGFVLLRPYTDGDGDVQYKVFAESKEQTHGFNFPLQLGTGSGDAPHHGDRQAFDVELDDVIVMATDGLWDNVFVRDIVDLVQECHDGGEMDKAASRLAQLANKLGANMQHRSPFTERAWTEQKLQYPGGKLDDVTVVVSRVCVAPSPSDIPLL